MFVCVYVCVRVCVCWGWAGGSNAVEKQVRERLNACIVFNHMNTLGHLGLEGVIGPNKRHYLGKLGSVYGHEGESGSRTHGESSISQDSWRHQHLGPRSSPAMFGSLFLDLLPLSPLYVHR